MSSIISKLINLAGNITGTLPIANGGTGQTTATAAFNALSPMTTAGDMIYGGTSGAGTRLAAGTISQVLVGGASLPSWGNVPAAALPIVVPGTSAGAVSASGLTGSTSGSAIGAGFVGQVITSGSVGSGINIGTSIANLGSVTLTAGVWLILANATYDAGSITNTTYLACINTTSASSSGNVAGVDLSLGAINGGNGTITLFKLVSIGSSTTYFLNCQTNLTNAGTGAILGSILGTRTA